MATALASRGIHTEIRTLNGNCVAIPVTFTTGALGVTPTLAYDYDDSISIALTEGTPDLYIITIGTYGRFLSAVFTSVLAPTVAITPSGSASAGTVTLSVTADSLADTTVSGVIWVQL